MADAPGDYDATNTASVTDDGGSNPTISDKAHPIIISEGSGTGTGDCQFSTSTWNNIDGVEDIGVFDTNDNLLPFEIEKLDTSGNTAVVWVYVGSLPRDNTDQVKVAAGSGSTDDQDVTGTWDNANQNAAIVQHLQDSPLTATDSTSNNYDGNVQGASAISDGHMDGAASFDGTDDEIDVSSFDIDNNNPMTVVTSYRRSETDGSSQSGTPALAGVKPDSSNNWQHGWDGSGNARLEWSNDNTGSVSISYSADEWNILSGVYKPGSNTIIVYHNGSQAASKSVTMNTYNVSAELGIGVRDDTRHFDGDIDEVRIYTEEKSADWMQADYDASPAGGQTLFSWNGAPVEKTDSASVTAVSANTITTTETAESTDAASTTAASAAPLTGTETSEATDAASVVAASANPLTGTETATYLTLEAANLAETSLAEDITASETDITVNDASVFPDTPFRATIEDSNGNVEIIQVPSVDSNNDVLQNVLRGLEDTSAQSFSSGAIIDNRFTAGYWDNLNNRIGG